MENIYLVSSYYLISIKIGNFTYQTKFSNKVYQFLKIFPFLTSVYISIFDGKYICLMSIKMIICVYKISIFGIDEIDACQKYIYIPWRDIEPKSILLFQ